jgi:predicted nucleotidyltransferase
MVAPGEAPTDSDVDLLVDVEKGRKLLAKVRSQLSGKGL